MIWCNGDVVYEPNNCAFLGWYHVHCVKSLWGVSQNAKIWLFIGVACNVLWNFLFFVVFWCFFFFFGFFMPHSLAWGFCVLLRKVNYLLSWVQWLLRMMSILLKWNLLWSVHTEHAITGILELWWRRVLLHCAHCGFVQHWLPSCKVPLYKNPLSFPPLPLHRGDTFRAIQAIIYCAPQHSLLL